MTHTDTPVAELSREIPNLREVSENGWVLAWGGDAENQVEKPLFEIVCSRTTTAQIKALNERLDQAYGRALAELK